ncbi:hypothetical protein [Vibrio jasicida]|uniref:hypothetical protein n=1 Tax=Vibrio jasicida TaxID=766224 RepID=UPI000CE31AD9|nr:hypothetical protein [Vibrio jasicida]
MQDKIAMLSAAIALLSAIYARYSYSQAKKANQLVYHSLIKPIYVAFDELRIHMDSTGKFADKSTVQKFLPYKRDAEIYLDKKTYKYMHDYWEACFYMADLSEQTKAGRTSVAQNSKIAECTKIENQLSKKISKRIKNKLTLGL